MDSRVSSVSSANLEQSLFQMFCLLGPVFVVQWLFDEAQLTVDNVHLTGQPVQEGQWLYIQNLGRELRSTLKDVT